MAISTGQVRQRNPNHDDLADVVQIRVGEPHPLFANVWQLYDARTGKPCGVWSGKEIEKNYSTI